MFLTPRRNSIFSHQTLLRKFLFTLLRKRRVWFFFEMRSTFRHQILRKPNVEPPRGVCDRDIVAPSRERSSRFTVGRFGLHRKGRGGESGDRIYRGLPKFPAGFLRPVTGKRKIPAARHQPRMFFLGGSQFSLPDAGH